MDKLQIFTVYLNAAVLIAFFLYGVSSLLLELIASNPLFAPYAIWLNKLALTYPNLAKPLGLCHFCFVHWFAYLTAPLFACYVFGFAWQSVLFYGLIIIFTTSIFNLCHR